ncbi:MAG: malate synthase G [Alphaproteobacteria bacterium]|nr:malate synthase G [Alphaproteobacteria bacterium]
MIDRAGLKVAKCLADFIEQEALAGLPVTKGAFWEGLAGLVARFGEPNRQLLATREHLQTQIDAWHRANGPVSADPAAYELFLRDIGYLVDEPANFSIDPGEMDPEITTICGPQLVVPVSNARYALNAANARWGSLYDALYGTDAINQAGELAPGTRYNADRGKAVFDRAAAFLDEAFPLAGASHRDVVSYSVDASGGRAALKIKIGNGPVELAEPGAFVGYRLAGGGQIIVLRHHDLHAELHIDRDHRVGRDHRAGLADLVLESAISTIQDCEDSVAAVDGPDKVLVYRNWLGLMTGALETRFEKGGKTISRKLAGDRAYTAPKGGPLTLKGRALLLVRNVGHLMTTDAVLDAGGAPIGEGILDGAVTALCALHDRTGARNSTVGAIYVVKPKMHGPDEVQFTCDLFGAIEEVLGLARHTIKIGIMDEERRTSANLKACIFAARHRVFFVNTGFLDRTGDEIHTSIGAGPVLPKDEIKSAPWISAYEDRNVLIGLLCGLSGKAQIGKGMWARPDDMDAMLAAKGAHPDAGANCAWVPSPTAATLHAMHYHETDVFSAQRRRHNEASPPLEALFSMPVLDGDRLDEGQINRELDNNAQGILGYVVRWIDFGVGCSKVPDINDVGLMEDRATLRISSQHIANWLAHGVVTEEQVRACFERMAGVVDTQNRNDPAYKPMAENFETSIAFQAALRLALEGAAQPSGYTEPILHAMRQQAKAAQAVG